ALREELRVRGHHFLSETDTEVIPHLIEEHLRDQDDLLEALRRTASALQGAHAIVAMSRRAHGQIVATRMGNAGAVVVGYADGAALLASDIAALLPYTRTVSFLYDGELVRITADAVDFVGQSGAPLTKERVKVPFDELSARKGTYKHYMLKE